MTRQGATRKAAGERGVYQVISETRKAKTTRGKTIPDVCYYIAFKIDGKLTWEKIGWLSEGYTAQIAKDIREERRRSLRHGEELPQQKKRAPTFAKLAEKYLAWSAESKNREGIEDKSRYERHLKERFDDKRLDEIAPFDLERLKADMAKAGKSPKTTSHCLALLRAMYNKAAAWGLYDGPNPVRGVKMPTVQNARDRFLSPEEAELLLKELRRNPYYNKKYIELKDPKLHDISLLSLHTGARASEIFKLRGQDLDFKNELITLRDTKNTQTRYAPMTAPVKEMLENRKPEDPTDYIFKKGIRKNAETTDPDDLKITEVSNAFQRVVDRLGFNDGVTDRRQKVVFHTLRHSFASWLAIQGTPLYTIAKLMGHKSIAMSERYSHLSPDHKRDAVRGLEAVLNGSKESSMDQPEAQK